MKIKIFGERNTGTNAITQLLKRNSKSYVFPGTMREISINLGEEIRVKRQAGLLSNEEKESMIDNVFLDLGLLKQWKHTATRFRINDDIKDTHFIFTVREPHSWLVGFFKRPHHILVNKPDNLLDFAQLDWRVVARDNLANTYYKPMELYAEKLYSYIEFINELEKRNMSYSIVRFEVFVQSQKAIFDDLKCYLDSPSAEFFEVNESTKDKSKDSQFYKHYYKHEIWKEEYPDIKKIVSPIDKATSKLFGFC